MLIIFVLIFPVNIEWDLKVNLSSKRKNTILTFFYGSEEGKVLETYGLTSSQLTLLATIYWMKQQKQDVTQILLSKTANIDRTTTSTVLRALEKKALYQE